MPALAARRWPAAYWRSLLRGGDIGLIAALLVLLLTGSLYLFSLDGATRVRVYQSGKLFAELDLMARRTLAVPGPLGETIVEVSAGKARIARDPSPRQYCVRAGWLERAGQGAICLPNRTSIELIGRRPRAFDSLSY